MPILELSKKGLYWIRIPTVLIFDFVQLLKLKSMILYLPQNETAGLARFRVKPPSLLPCPPAKSSATHSCCFNLVHLPYNIEPFFQPFTQEIPLLMVRYLIFHIQSAYSLIVLSLENLPELAILTNAIPLHFC